MLELSDKDLKLTMINRLQALTTKAGTVQTDMGIISKEIISKKESKRCAREQNTVT